WFRYYITGGQLDDGGRRVSLTLGGSWDQREGLMGPVLFLPYAD
ncbi:hypothetical protein JMJ77_0000384, partial [Colletotrichum scovillei]